MGKKANLKYVLNTVSCADKKLVWFTLIKNSLEQIFPRMPTEENKRF